MWDIHESNDDAQLASLFDGDRDWCAYCLCDLDQPYRRYTRFIGAFTDNSLRAAVTLFELLAFTSLVPCGEPEGVKAIFASGAGLPEVAHTQVRQEDLAAIRLHYQTGELDDMFRMAARSSEAAPPASDGPPVRRLTMSDVEAVRRLYAHLEDFSFEPITLQNGIFHGAFEGDELIAISGTHAHSVRYNMAAVGGVFTHPAHRGRGLATRTTAYVVQSLIELGIEDIALNVKQANAPAIHAYQHIGFRTRLPFLESQLQRLTVL